MQSKKSAVEKMIFWQYLEITIHRAFTYIGYQLSYLVVYPIGGWVGSCASQYVENSLSLLCVSVHWLVKNGS